MNLIEQAMALPPIWRMGSFVLALLVVASLAVIALKFARPKMNIAEIESRTMSWWVMAGLFFMAVAFNDKASLVFFAFMSFWALKEYVTLLKTRGADHTALLLCFVAIPIQYWFVYIRWHGMFLSFIPVYMFLILPVGLVLAKETAGFVASASQIQWGLMAFVFGLSHMRYLAGFPGTEGTGSDGKTLLLFLVFVAETSDVMQFVWGKTLGKHKVIPAVSPNKTWEGLIGGVLSATALSLLIRWLTPFTVIECLLMSLLICVAGFFGGAVMSAVKRDFGVKDFGGLIPGHGGMLDRLDALCWSAPLFMHVVLYFHY